MRLTYKPEHIEFLRAGYLKMKISDLTVAYNKAFGLDKTEQMIRAATRNHKIRSGRTGRFEKGNISFNKGKTFYAGGRSEKTQFKKGNQPKNSKPMGDERVCTKDGFILIKVAEKNPYTGAPTRYKHKHIVVCEKEKGPVPDGKVVFFLDSDRLNCEPENLVCITRAELLYLNQHGYSDLPVDLKPSMLALAKLETKRFSLEKR